MQSIRPRVRGFSGPSDDFAGSLQAAQRLGYDWGRSGDGWLFVIDSEIVSQLSIEVSFVDGAAMEAVYSPSDVRSEDGGTWLFPCPPTRETGPLTLEIVPPYPTPGPLQVTLTDPEAFQSDQYDWGHVVEKNCLDRDITAEGGKVTFEGVRLGVPYLVRVIDEATGASISKTLSHDGAAHCLELEPGLEVTGRFIDENGEAIDGPLVVRWGRRPRQEPGLLPCLSPEMVVAENGLFVLRAPIRGPTTVTDCHRLPMSWQGSNPDRYRRAIRSTSPVVIEVHTEGLVDEVYEVPCEGSPKLDCGDLLLRRAPPELVLPIERVGPPSPSAGMEATAITGVRLRGDYAGRWLVADILPNGRNQLDVYLKRADYDTPGVFSFDCCGSSQLQSRELPDVIDAVLLISPQNPCFRSDEGGSFRREVSVDYKAELVGDWPKDIAVVWRSMMLAVTRTEGSDGSLRLQFHGPRRGVMLRSRRGHKWLEPGYMRIEY